MKITSNSIKISAPLSHVYNYISDISLIYKEFQTCIKHEDSDLKISLNENYIVIYNENRDKSGQISIDNKQQNQFSTLVIEPASPYLKRFGSIYITNTINEIDNHVICTSVFTSEKHPSLVWRLLIKAVFKIWMLQSRKYEKSYIQRIEQTALFEKK